MWNERKGLSLAVAFAAAAGASPALASGGANDFDFLVGEWRVHHKRLKPGTQEWIEFKGTCSQRKLLGGSANVEEHALDSPTGAYQAVGLRAFDAKTGQWAIWWVDGRYPSRLLDPPAKGRFEDGLGRFYADYTQDGKPMRGRLQWSEITATSARFEQSSSTDGGKTWSPNWIMKFERASGPVAAQKSEASDFDFLDGNWRVQHRYLRAGPTGREWVRARGTARQRPLMGGRANLEEHTIDAPSGPYRALALRSFDPRTSQWSIWWLDGRSPHGELDPPVRGGFERGVGTFHGETTIGGKPTRVRYVWSEITPTSARWEQAYGSDAGPDWESNWVMEFSREAAQHGLMHDVRHVSISIDRRPGDVYEFVSDPRNLPRWAAGLSRSEIRQDGDEWVADAPFGKARIKFVPKNPYGVLDHDVRMESGVTVHNPMRVVPNGEGSEFIFTLFRQPGMPDARFAEDQAAIEKDLRTLKELLERKRS